MKLLRSLLTPVAALAIASPALAQFDPNQKTSTDVALWLNTQLSAPIQMTQAPGQPILDAFCTDFVNGVHTNPEAVNITRFDADAADFNANTRFGYAKLDSYKKAAWLTQFLNPSFGFTGSEIADLRFTIWHLFTSVPLPARPGEAYFNGLLASNEWQGVPTYYWFVISDPNMTGGRFPQSGGNQEYITMVTPEPSAILLLGTGMLGIVGLAARRRKNKK